MLGSSYGENLADEVRPAARRRGIMITRTLSASSGTGMERLDFRVAVVALSFAFYALTFLPLHGA